ncbi:MAG: polyprenyl synthetase family protein [bacterium]|nr:polyprenyl synthetase family protein [bacterium]
MCAHRGLGRLADRLSDMVAFVGQDLEAFEVEFATLPRDGRLVERAASHLLDLGGKRLRPMCLALAAKVGSGFDRRVLDLAVAVELVHSATLLHDDVVDLSDVRRGAPTARAVYGNAASIFAGDWLLIEALRRVNSTGVPVLLEELFGIIEEMIFAESLQLEARGRVSTDRDLYFRVVEGKTASVFRWAMSSGGRVGGLGDAERRALIDYGRHLGIAFQATDDLLDLTGDASRTGKELFTDLREGKMTFPLIVALERDPELEPVIAEILDNETISDLVSARVVRALRETRAVEECLALARQHSGRALAALEALPENRARRALVTVAETIVDRDL